MEIQCFGKSVGIIWDVCYYPPTPAHGLSDLHDAEDLMQCYDIRRDKNLSLIGGNRMLS